MISVESLKYLLGIKEDFYLSTQDMASSLKVTFFPVNKSNAPSYNVVNFSNKLKKSLMEKGVEVIDYEKSLTIMPLKKIIKWGWRLVLGKIKYKDFNLKIGKKIKPGIAVIVTGEAETGRLPMDNTMSFRKNPIITIVDFPKGISEDSNYKDHIDTAFNLFSWNLSNLVIGVSDEKWIIYSFNGSNAIYNIKDFNFSNIVLDYLVPKIAAPVIPPKIEDFEIRKNSFHPDSKDFKGFINDLIEGSKAFKHSDLFPDATSVDDLRFRNSYYKWIGKLHLDKRSGMSFGFFAKQVYLSPEEATKEIMLNDLDSYRKITPDLYEKNNKLYLCMTFFNKHILVNVPKVTVFTSRSGSDKTNLDKNKDIIKMDLIYGKKILGFSKSISTIKHYRPSYDTNVILAHSLCLAVYAQIFDFFKINNIFLKEFKVNGSGLVHWHGYVNKKYKDKFEIYGFRNPAVSCSSPQSAIYAFRGKEGLLRNAIENNNYYNGDVHIEPQHGVNLSCNSILELSSFIFSNKDFTSIGNKYFDYGSN